MWDFLKDTKKMIFTAMLAALAFLLSLIEIPTPFLSYLSLDASEIPILLTAELLGNGALIVVAFLRSALRFVFKGTLIFGEVAAIIASISLGLIFTSVRKKYLKNDENRNKKTIAATIIGAIFISVAAIISLLLSDVTWKVGGVITFSVPLLASLIALGKKDAAARRRFVETITTIFSVTAVMVVLNFIFVTPSNALQKPCFAPEIVNLWFAGSYRAYIYATILPLIPFNMVKLILTIIIYYIVERVKKYQKTTG